MSAGSGSTIVHLEPPKDADLRVALAIEQANNCVLRHTVQHQQMIIADLNRVLSRQNSRSSN